MSRPTLLYGLHAVAAALDTRPGEIRELWLQERSATTKRMQGVLEQARKAGIPVQTVRAEALNRHTDGATHQGVAARAPTPNLYPETALPGLLPRTGARLLVLDGITDPHNFGASLRVAEAAGISAVLVPAHRRAPLSPVACKAASGSAERVPVVQATNLNRALRTLRDSGIWLYAADAEGDIDLWEATFEPPWALVMGAEGTGLRVRTRALCDASIRIPMQGEAQSLNVSCAAGILLFAASRPVAAQT